MQDLRGVKMPRGYFFVLVSIALYWALKLTLGNKKAGVQESPNRYFALFSVALFFVLKFGVGAWGLKIPGAVLERNEYEGYYQARLYKGEQFETFQTVPVYIRASLESSQGFGDDQDTQYEERVYMLDHLVLPNGKRLSFKDGGTPVEIRKVNILTSRTDTGEVGDSYRMIWGGAPMAEK